MKKSTVLCGIAAAMLAFSAVPSFADEITPESISDSGCKGSAFVAPSSETRSSDFLLPSWSLEYKDGRLTIIVHDLEANCCPERFGSLITLEAGKIIFTSGEEGMGPCDCVCLFDVESTFSGIPSGHYQIVFRSYYVDLMTVDVDLEEGYKGFFKVQEDAVRELAASDGSLVVKNGIVKVASPGRFSLDVFSASGVKEYTLEENDETELSLRGFAKGIHFLRLTPADGKTVTLPVLL